MNANSGEATSFTRVWDEGIRTWRRQAGERRDPGSKAFWDGFDLWEEYEKYVNYPGALFEPILAGIGPETTVLDIGAGSGCISIPLAQKCRWVTALEPSSAQIARLTTVVRNKGIDNVTMIPKTWEEIHVRDIGLHDVVIASYCLFMEDISSSLRKMYEVARDGLFLVHLESHDLQKPMREIRGEGGSMPELATLLGVLNELDMPAELEVFTRDFELPLELQLKMFRYAQGFTEEQVDLLREHLETAERIFHRDGKQWVTRRFRDALLSIRKGER